MVGIWFPALVIPELTIPRIVLLDVWLVGVHIKVVFPKIVILPKTTIWAGFKLFDTDDITEGLRGLFAEVPQAVWNLFESTLNSMVEDYYERHSEGEE